MSSYKPVIYIFSLLGVTGILGAGYLSVQTLRAFSQYKNNIPYSDVGRNDTFPFITESVSGTSANPLYADQRIEDPNAREINDRRDGDTSPKTRVLYSTMQDDTVMMELTIPEGMDLMLRELLQRPDTSLQELFRSDTKLALKMTALGQDIETILVQDLVSGDIYDTKIDAHANFKFVGPQIVHIVASPDRPDELTQVLVYDLETNRTTPGKPLTEAFSYTKKVDVTGPIAQMTVKNGKIEIQVFPTKESARFDTDRAPVRVERYPSGS